MARRIKEDAIVHQERIAKGAMTVFANKGIANTTMDDIAKSLMISKKTIYTVFTDKESLFLSMVDYLFDGIKKSEEDF